MPSPLLSSVAITSTHNDIAMFGTNEKAVFNSVLIPLSEIGITAKNVIKWSRVARMHATLGL